MNTEVRMMLEAVRDGSLTVDEALLELKKEPFKDIDYAKVDLHRRLRQGASEVIYGAGKTPEQMLGIVRVMQDAGQRTILITRMSEEAAELVGASVELDYHKEARIGIVGKLPKPDRCKKGRQQIQARL